MNKKLVFFDVDGTLSSPYYMVDGRLQIGMSDKQWDSYCREYGEDAYQWCKPVPQVKDYAVRAKKNGASLYVLTTSSTDRETEAKRKFIQRYYDGVFEDIYAVCCDDDKVGVILKKAQECGVSPQECEMVEDTYRILLQTVTAGIESTHISTILTME